MAEPTSTPPPAERRVVVTGATGLIGTALVDALRAAGHPVTRLVRRAPSGDDRRWDPSAGSIDADAVEGAWAIVHLAGAGIADRKWTDAHKRAVLDSRVHGTTLLATAIAGATRKPSVFASGSAIGVYGDRGDEWLPESAPTGVGFLADVAKAWEAAAAPAAAAGVRTAFLRTGIVLSTLGGALKPQLLPFKLGLGGRLGSGRQYQSWITLDDEVRAIRHVLDTPSISGPVNLAAPEPVTNAQFTAALGKAVHRPTLLPIPLPVLKVRFGPEMVREMLLAGQRVRPEVLASTGFRFEHPELGAALADLLSKGT